MKNVFKILIFMLLCMGQTGCFFLSSASSGSKSSSTSSSSSSEYIYTSDQLLCSRRWELTYGETSTHYYRNGQFLSTTTNEAKNYYRRQWIQFYSNHTCYESGLYGSNGQQLTWRRNGNKVIIYGRNLQLGTEVVSNQVELNVEAITSNYLRVVRLINPKTTNGQYSVRMLVFDNK